MTAADLRLGVVGCGWAGQEAIRSAQAVDGVSVIAISDLNDDLCEGAATAYGVHRHYGDYRELLADDAVDAVYLAVNPVMRHAMVLDSFAAGKHALVQKPHAVRAEQVLEYEKAAAAAQKTLQFCYFMRHDPKNRTLRAAIARGDIGQPYHGRVFQKYNSSPAPSGVTLWEQVYGQKGGVLGQHTSHELNLVWWWMGSPAPLWAFATKHVVNQVYAGPEGPAEDYLSGIVGLAGGKTLQVDCTRWLHCDPPWIVELYGKTGAIRDGLIHRFDKDATGDPHTTAEPEAPLDVPHTAEPEEKRWFYHEIEHFALAVAGEVSPDVDSRDAYQFMRILDALYDSALTEEKVVLEPARSVEKHPFSGLAEGATK